MKQNANDSSDHKTDNSEKTAPAIINEKYKLKLYIAGSTPRSVRAIGNIKKICEEHLKGQYELKVIDLYLHPGLARGEQIIALPTLIKNIPPPLRRIIGDLSNIEKVLVGLDLSRVDGE